VALAAVLAAAFVLRVAGALYDLPYGFHPDEHHFLDKALLMVGGRTLNPSYFENPPLYTYAIVMLLHVLSAVQYLTAGAGGSGEFPATLSAAVTFGTARGLAALAGTGVCFLVFLIGKRFGGDLAGFLAAGFSAVAFLSVRDAHFGVNDIPMVVLVTLSFLFAMRVFERGRRRDLILGGLTAGLAAATKYNGGIAVLPLLLACLLGPVEGQGRPVRDRAREIGVKWLTVVLSGLAGFLLGNPYAILDTGAFLGGLMAQYGLRGKMWLGQSAVPVPILIVRALETELGWPLLLFFPLAAAACIVGGGPRAKAAWLALSPVVILLFYHASQSLFFARFLLPCTPFIALVCAWGIVALRETAWPPWARPPIVLWTLVTVLAAVPLARSLYLDVILHRADTRILAKAYLERVAPSGSTIVFQGRQFYPTYTPPLDGRRYRLVDLATDPSVFLTDARADYYLFSSFITGRVPGVLEAEERSLAASLERFGFARVSFSPLRDGGDPPFENDQVYLPYRGLFRYERPGPALTIYARPGTPLPPPAGVLRGAPNPNPRVPESVRARWSAARRALRDRVT
jgi:4-amino-4-deoxy-L-arabinose transferase-like glycosyltransferase